MNRIFYIHSNILTICCYPTVKECIARGEKVIIITNRGCTWPYFEEEVIIYDFAKIFQGEDKRNTALHSIRALNDYWRYRKFLAHLKSVVNKIIDKDNFYFYLPSMDMAMTYAFAHSRYCMGYYYVDEGFLAYTPAESLKRYIPNKIKNFIKTLFGLGDHYHLETTSKFKGTISISADAFAWNTDKERIVNSVEDYIDVVKQDIPFFDDVILTEYLTQDFEVIKNCIDFAMGKIFKKNPQAKVGIKIHPHAITYNKEKTVVVQKYLVDNYAHKVSLIPANVSIEVMSLVHHPTLYSLLELSSIIMYAIIFKSSKTMLIDYKNDAISFKTIASMEDYIENKVI